MRFDTNSHMIGNGQNHRSLRVKNLLESIFFLLLLPPYSDNINFKKFVKAWQESPKKP